MQWLFYDISLFYPLSALALLLIAAGGYRLRLRRRKTREKEIIRLMEERLELLELRTHQLEQTNQDLQRLSYLDGLTGIANRRHFEEALDLEWRRACRVGMPLSLIMIDADFFKAFNDAYGHQRGDDCLVLLASTLRNALNRPGDMAARYGGEEFIIILPGTDAEGAAEMAETIRARVEEMGIAHAGSPADKVVTISLGVVTGYPTRGFSPAALIAAADEALYQAKEGGRNRVIISREGVAI
ncbi:MAG TPA: diguanylate cyclase [Blastocatellia bacterium]|nr:diguanylate cyclase [Blastocatellia bacterium]